MVEKNAGGVSAVQQSDVGASVAKAFFHLTHRHQAQRHASNRLPSYLCALWVLIGGYLPHALPVVTDQALALVQTGHWGQLLFRGRLAAAAEKTR